MIYPTRKIAEAIRDGLNNPSNMCSGEFLFRVVEIAPQGFVVAVTNTRKLHGNETS